MLLHLSSIVHLRSHDGLGNYRAQSSAVLEHPDVEKNVLVKSNVN